MSLIVNTIIASRYVIEFFPSIENKTKSFVKEI